MDSKHFKCDSSYNNPTMCQQTKKLWPSRVYYKNTKLCRYQEMKQCNSLHQRIKVEEKVNMLIDAEKPF